MRLPHFVGADPQQPEAEMDRAWQQEKPEMALPLKPRTTGEQREIATRTGVRSREKWELFPYRQKWRKHGALTAALRHLRRPKKGREARTKRGRSKSEPRGQQDSSRLSLCLPVPFYPGNVEMFRRFRTRPQFPHSLRRMPIRGLNIGCCETRYHSTLYE